MPPLPPSGLEYADTNGNAKPVRSYYFLEADRGTMPIRRQNPSQSSFHRKLLAYEATWTQNLHRTRPGLHRFHVLTVTTTSARAKSLANACHQLERGHGLFLFTDAETYHIHSNPLTLSWLLPHDNPRDTLLDSLIPASLAMEMNERGSPGGPPQGKERMVERNWI